MAGAGAKKRAEENKRRLSTLRTIILVASVTFLAARLLIFSKSTTWVHWLGFGVTLAVHGLAYWTIAAVASPTYDPASGELLDGGADLNKGGLQSYYHDLLYITALVQVVAAFTSWGWYIALLVPGYALYALFSKVIYPYLTAQAPKEQEMDEGMRKQLEKAEKRAQRRAQKRF